jgi:hypothetical protein
MATDPSQTATDFLTDLRALRGLKSPGYNPNRFIKLAGGVEVPMSWNTPDAKTSRSDYYYNTRQNKLFKRTKATNPVNNKIVYYWQVVSDC